MEPLVQAMPRVFDDAGCAKMLLAECLMTVNVHENALMRGVSLPCVARRKRARIGQIRVGLCRRFILCKTGVL
jgi:hypothetical protein